MTENTATQPRAEASVRGNRASLVWPDGTSESLTFVLGEEVRGQLVMRAVAYAELIDAPIDLVTTGDLGEVHLVVHPGGHVVPASDPDAWATASGRWVADDSALPAARGEHADDASESVQAVDGTRGKTEPEATGGGDIPHFESRAMRRRRTSFIDTSDPVRVEPTSGWRRALRSVGLKVGAGRADIARAAARRAVSGQWGERRRIAIVNGKGGVGKTTTAAMLSAVFAREGSGGVLAWDNNPTRGSLGWRTEQSAHDATVQDVLEHTEKLLHPDAPNALIANYVHRQRDDKFDVLRSNPQMLATRQAIGHEEFDLLIRVADRNYRLVVFDSGNDESAPRWLRMIDQSHQLVIPTIPSPEAAESAMLLLDELVERDDHSRHLAEQAIIVLLQNESSENLETPAIVAGFEEAGLHVMQVPYDAALRSGPLRFEALTQTTQDAWLQVAARSTEHF